MNERREKRAEMVDGMITTMSMAPPSAIHHTHMRSAFLVGFCPFSSHRGQGLALTVNWTA